MRRILFILNLILFNSAYSAQQLTYEQERGAQALVIVDGSQCDETIGGFIWRAESRIHIICLNDGINIREYNVWYANGKITVSPFYK